MKIKLALSLVILLVSKMLTAQKSLEEWKQMTKGAKLTIDNILQAEFPNEPDIKTIKVKFYNGSLTLSQQAEEQIKSAIQPIKNYGATVLQNNSIEASLENTEIDYLVAASVPPGVSFQNNDALKGDITLAGKNAPITGGDILHCALDALGVSAIASLATELNAATWSLGNVTRIFRKAASRLLGPIGVAIAVIEFGRCLYNLD
jgi:hypothetical protein